MGEGGAWDRPPPRPPDPLPQGEGEVLGLSALGAVARHPCPRAARAAGLEADDLQATGRPPAMPPTRRSMPSASAMSPASTTCNSRPTPPRGVCPPPDFTPDLLAQVVTAYADTHEDGPAPAAIGQAIVRFFPCREQQR